MDILNALDGNGFIIKQSKLTDVPFGKYTADEHGCGMIAAYNAAKAAGVNPKFDNAVKYFVDHTFLNGKHGATAFQISGYLRKFGLAKGYLFGKKNYSKVDVGILWYKHSAGWHYVAFYSVGNGKFNFLNADERRMVNIRTMDDFFKTYVKCKLSAVFIVKKGG